MLGGWKLQVERLILFVSSFLLASWFLLLYSSILCMWLCQGLLCFLSSNERNSNVDILAHLSFYTKEEEKAVQVDVIRGWQWLVNEVESDFSNCFMYFSMVLTSSYDHWKTSAETRKSNSRNFIFINLSTIISFYSFCIEKPKRYLLRKLNWINLANWIQQT